MGLHNTVLYIFRLFVKGNPPMIKIIFARFLSLDKYRHQKCFKKPPTVHRSKHILICAVAQTLTLLTFQYCMISNMKHLSLI